MTEIHGSPGDAPQMPAAPNSGPAPVPYAGADLSPEPPDYGVDLGPVADAGDHVMGGVTGLGTTESPAAHDIAAGVVDAPYYPGDLSPVDAMGDPDAGGRDDVSGTVGGAVTAAEARFAEHQADTYGQGSVIGDLMDLPHSPMNPAVGTNAPANPPFEEPFFPETNPA